VQEIAHELKLSRTTVRKYLKHPEAVIPKPRPPRSSKLDAYKEQIKKWVMEDHCANCEVIFERLQKMGYTGGISILKEYVQPLLGLMRSKKKPKIRPPKRLEDAYCCSACEQQWWKSRRDGVN